MTRSIQALDLHFPPLAAAADLPDRVAAALHDLSPAAIYEMGDDSSPTWRVFPADSSQVTAIADRLANQFGAEGCRVQPVQVADEDWAARTQSGLTRVTVGRITVAPPWDVPATVPADAHLVVIQPSMGFGTGHHETTRLCLRLLQDVDVAGRRVVDVGTGSGVLAIAARLLGAADVEAIDVDEDALASARESLALNGLSEQVRLRHGDIGIDEIESADLVLANLTGALLMAQSGVLLRLARPGGRLVLSGFQRQDTGAVEDAFRRGARTLARVGEGEWEALLLQTAT